MASLPTHLISATRSRRVVVGLANAILLGGTLMLAGGIADQTWAPAEFSIRARLLSIGLVSIAWVFCVVRKTSIGAAVCLVEIRAPTGERPRCIQMVLRTAPAYVLVGVGLTPVTGLPRPMVMIQGLIWLALFLATVTSALFALITRTSLFDRISRTTLVQLRLPEHLKPRAFGMRITR